MPAPDTTIVTTTRVWYFTENQVRNVTINQLEGGEEIEVEGSWTFGAEGQTIRSCAFLDTSALEGALTGAQAGTSRR